MIYSPPLIPAKLKSRYKRFLADVELSSGERITVHCPNTGSMRNCIVEDSACWLHDSNNPKRKYRYTLEWVTGHDGALVGVNTHRPNSLVYESISEGKIAELNGYKAMTKEKMYGSEGSRIDIFLSLKDRADCYVEVKSVTLVERGSEGLFPDSISVRGTKHLRELQREAQNGARAVLLFCVQRTGVSSVSAAAHIDPAYAQALEHARIAGVEVYAFATEIDYDTDSRINGVRLCHALPVL